MGKNKGTAWQTELQTTADAYRALGRAKLHKVDPPTKVLGRRVIFLRNPFLDFIGCFGDGARTLVIEAKFTEKHRLAIYRKTGVTDPQMATLGAWEDSGAVALVLWRFRDRVRALTPSGIRAELARTGEASLEFGAIGAPLVAPGTGYVLWDFLPIAESLDRMRRDAVE